MRRLPGGFFCGENGESRQAFACLRFSHAREAFAANRIRKKERQADGAGLVRTLFIHLQRRRAPRRTQGKQGRLLANRPFSSSAKSPIPKGRLSARYGFQVALRVPLLRGLDQKERDCARGMNGNAGYAPVKPGVSTFAPVGAQG